MEDAVKLMLDVRACVGAVRESLREPTPLSLTRSWPLLQEAIDHLGRLQGCFRDGARNTDAALSHSALALQREVLQLRALLESCASFTLGWTHCLGAMYFGYTPRGVPLQLDAGGQVLLEG